MTDNLDDLLANVDDLDDFLRQPEVEENDQAEPENIEVSVDSQEVSDSIKDDAETSAPPAEEKTQPPPGEVPGVPVTLEKPVSVEKPDGQYAIPGTKEWNTSPPYTIKIDDNALKKEQDQLANIFFYVDTPVSESSGSDTVKKALIDFMRKPDRDMFDKYKVFLYQELLKELLEINTIFLDNGSDEKELFYHIGPVTSLKILMGKFKIEKRGYCFCYTGSGRGVRIIPEETIKTVIMNWYNENIFSANIDFDNISVYEKVKRSVNEVYREDRKRFQMLLEKVNLRAGNGRSVSASRFLSIKGDDIFGPAKLHVYRRFIGNNIFL